MEKCNLENYDHNFWLQITFQTPVQHLYYNLRLFVWKPVFTVQESFQKSFVTLWIYNMFYEATVLTFKHVWEMTAQLSLFSFVHVRSVWWNNVSHGVFTRGEVPITTHLREHIEGQFWSDARTHLRKHAGAVTELCPPEVPVATFLILSSRVNLTLYGVAMVTC